MALKQNVSGTWKDLTCWINVSGTWKQAVVWKNVSGTWKQITTLLSASLPSSISAESSDFNSASYAQITVSSAGTWNTTASSSGNSSGTWMTSGAAGDFEVRFTVTSGSTPSGSATGTWLACSTSRTWSFLVDPGVLGCTGTLEIRAAGGSVLATSTIYLSATSEYL